MVPIYTVFSDINTMHFAHTLVSVCSCTVFPYREVTARNGDIGHVARMGETGNAYRILVGKPEGKRPLGRRRRRRVDNIKMDLKRDRMVRYGLD
jgi:hypothetical protein